MRALLPRPSTSADQDGAVDVHDWYAADWVDTGGIRANMIASVDGAAAAAGLTAGLQTAADNRVFAALRDLADVVLVGWSTARAEDYAPIDPSVRRVALRARHGFGPRLPIALITRSLSIPDDSRLLGAPDTLIITTASSDPDRRKALAERVTVLVCGSGDDIDYAAVRSTLAERGLRRLLCEGGPTILSSALRAGEIDELCLTVSPFVTGPGEPRIVAGEEWGAGARRLRLAALLEDDGALFARYRRD